MKILHVASDRWLELSPKFDEEYMKIILADNPAATEQFSQWLTPHGDYKITNQDARDADFLICWGVTQMENAKRIHNKFPHLKLINYNWDIYEWAVKNPRPGEYNYKEYVKFLSQSYDIWCPADSVKQRTIQWCKEWENRDVSPHIILSH
jgi:hypothetical protein